MLDDEIRSAYDVFENSIRETAINNETTHFAAVNHTQNPDRPTNGLRNSTGEWFLRVSIALFFTCVLVKILYYFDIVDRTYTVRMCFFCSTCALVSALLNLASDTQNARAITLLKILKKYLLVLIYTGMFITSIYGGVKSTIDNSEQYVKLSYQKTNDVCGVFDNIFKNLSEISHI